MPTLTTRAVATMPVGSVAAFLALAQASFCLDGSGQARGVGLAALVSAGEGSTWRIPRESPPNPG